MVLRLRLQNSSQNPVAACQPACQSFSAGRSRLGTDRQSKDSRYSRKKWRSGLSHFSRFPVSLLYSKHLLGTSVNLLLQGGNDIGGVTPRTAAPLLCRGVAHLQFPEPLDGSFPGQSRYFTDRQQEFALSPLACLPILRLLFLKYVVFCRPIHLPKKNPHFYLPDIELRNTWRMCF